MPNYFFDSNRVRYEMAKNRGGGFYNWLFFPGGPGADSRYLHSLIDILELPGNVWLIDLPGNGDNTKVIPQDYDFNQWIELFLPCVQKFENPVLVGHSFGGMFPLLFPELEQCLKGFIILNAAPSLWLEEAVAYSRQFKLPDLTHEMQAFTQNPNEITFKLALDACMPYYFPSSTLEKGRALLSQIPFQYQPAVWWQRKAIELNFSAKWVPQHVSTLIVGGTYDCIAPFTLFQKDKRFSRPNIQLSNIEEGGHCGWVENPEAMRNLFKNFCSLILR